MLPAPVFTYHYLWRTYADLMHRFPSTAPVFHAALIGCLQPWMDNNERLIASWRAERKPT